ncbi:MAG: SlyX family protein [Planctomycetaceae bacterium]|nr:SlyX family protein [Planctomycetaceae bacterium]
MEQRLTNVESLLSHLQYDYDQLNQVVQKQQQQIEALQRQFQKLIDRIEPSGLELPDPLDEKPPHY